MAWASVSTVTLQTPLHREAKEVFGRILSLGTAVDLHGLVELGAGREHDVGVEGRRWAAAAHDLAVCAVAEDVGVGGWRWRPPFSASSPAEGIRSFEWTEATTTSSSASSSSERSRDPSARMSTSIPVRILKGAISTFSSAISSICWRRRSSSRPWATVRRAEWSVIATHSWPRAAAVSAMARIGAPPSDQVVWQWQSPRRRSSTGPPDPTGTRLRCSSWARYPSSTPAKDSAITPRRAGAHAVELGEGARRGSLGELPRR